MKIKLISSLFLFSASLSLFPFLWGTSNDPQYPVGNLSDGLFYGLFTPNSPPPGANNFNCVPSPSHPYPVVLVHGTFENEALNWQDLAPQLANNGFCVFTFNYGQTAASLGVFDGLGEIAQSASQLATFIQQVLAFTGANKVDIVGHSQGGMMPRYYIKYLGGASKVHTLVGLAPSNHGSTLDGLVTLANNLSLLGFLNPTLDYLGAPALVEQEAGSSFLQELNSPSDVVPGPNYVVIETTHDEVVTPYESAFLSGANTHNILLQNQCPNDPVGHIGIAYDQVAIQDVLATLNGNYNPSVSCIGYGIGL